MHDQRNHHNRAQEQRQPYCRAYNTPDSSLVHNLFSLAQPRRKNRRKNVRNYRDSEEYTRTVNHMLVQLFGFIDRQASRPYTIGIVDIICHIYLRKTATYR